MKRFILAAAVLLGAAVGFGRADYLIIRANLNTADDQSAGRGENPPGVAPGPGAMNPQAMQQQMRRMMGGGARGAPPTAPGQAGGGDYERQQQQQMRRMMQAGLGPGGARGGPPTAPGQGGGAMDQMRQQQQMMRRMMQGGGAPGEYGPGGEGEPVDPTNVWVMAAVELKKHTRSSQTGREMYEHRWGKTRHYSDEQITVQLVRKPPVAEQFEAKRKELAKDRAEKDPGRLQQLARWALEHDLLNQFESTMDQLVKLDPKLPAAANYQQAKTALNKEVTEDDPAVAWKDRLSLKSYVSPHYTVLYDSASNDPPEVISRANRLEKNFRAFFYWFALRGRVLPVPERRLIAIMVERSEEFWKDHAIFDSMPLESDGFYARRDNLIVFSTSRLDEGYEALKTKNEGMRSNGWNPEALLQGLGRKGYQYDEIARNQMWVLLQRAMKEEGEIATVSHEGTRQLLAATGLLPRTVEVPRWIEFGLSSVFETPKSDPDAKIAVLWPIFGAPSWTYHVQFKVWELGKKLDDSSKALEGVVTDRYFHQAAQAENPKDAIHKARTMTWSLSYFLAEKKLDGLLKYLDELAKLPRDLAFDEDVLLGCFARSFGIADPSKPDSVDPQKEQALAREWYQFISYTPRLREEAIADAQKALKERKSVPSSLSTQPKPGPDGSNPQGTYGPQPPNAGQPSGRGAKPPANTPPGPKPGTQPRTDN
jgi:hypothetical protein